MPGAADDELIIALRQLGLENHIDLFLDEELTMKLLHDMGDLLVPNLLELGLTEDEARKIGGIVWNESVCCPCLRSSESSAPTVAGTSTSGFGARVAELQAEYFADDLIPPAGAEGWDEEKLVAFTQFTTRPSH